MHILQDFGRTVEERQLVLPTSPAGPPAEKQLGTKKPKKTD